MIMNGKMNQDYGDGASLDTDLLNPFTHRLELSTTYEKIKTAIFTILVLPFRVAAICTLLTVAWWFASVGLYGLSEHDLRTKPLSGWRKKIREIISIVGQYTYRAGGMKIVIKGRQVTRQEAPILVIAPHSTFLDAVIVYVTGFPSIISRWESGVNPWLGKLINYTQPVYVWRDDHDSRQNTIKEIIERANSGLDWPQILIFPEGTCTNRSCLITFKPGAFYPGVPVQPVCIRYPNKLDTVTWTWEGPGVALGVPVTNYTYDDCKLMIRAKQMNLPCAGKLVEIQKLRESLDLKKAKLEEEIISNKNYDKIRKSPQVSYSQFCNLLILCPTNPASLQLFQLCDKNSTGIIDFREYLLTALVISKSGDLLEFLNLVFKVIDEEGKDQISESDFRKILHPVLSISKERCSTLFHHIDKNNRGYITFDEFKEFARNKKEFSTIFKSNDITRSKSD